jgi:hypothetical protein
MVYRSNMRGALENLNQVCTPKYNAAKSTH